MQAYSVWQGMIDQLFQERSWRYWSPLSIAGRLLEEMGEVAREVNHHYGDKKKRSDEDIGDMEAEMGDIIYTLICFANSKGYDIDRIMRESLRESIVYYGVGPLSVLAELYKRGGLFADEVNRCYGGNVATQFVSSAFIETALGNTLRVLALLAQQTGCKMDVAFTKSISKVTVRDKDRFPEGI